MRFVTPAVKAAGAAGSTALGAVHTTANKTARWLDPNVDAEIMVEIGERKVLEIRKHWMASSWAIGRLLVGTALLCLLMAWEPEHWYGWIPWFWALWFVIVISTRATWRVLAHYRDRFVITNHRILRVDGVVGSDAAMIPKQRVTDITVKRTWLGRLTKYGHFIFESAGQVQGLDEIRYVSNPQARKRILLIAMNGENPDAIKLDPGEDNPTDGT